MYADDVKQYAIEHGLTEDNGIDLSSDITNQLVDHLNDLGIETHGSKDMEEDLRRREEAKVMEAEMQAIKDEAIKNGTFMKAPNGKPTKLTEKQWLQVRTKNFKNWFGDWENAPENASKVVDPETGEPMVVYHATKAKFNVFDSSFAGTGSGNTENTDGSFYFGRHKETVLDIFHTKTEEEKSHYNAMEVFLDIKNPNNMPLDEFNKTWFDKEAYSQLKTGDGIIAIPHETPEQIYERKVAEYNRKKAEGKLSMFDRLPDSPSDFMEEQSDHIYVVFDPNQIKSATDNTGTFSTENDDIRYFIDPYSLPNREFTKLESILLTQYGNSEDYGAVVHTVNYEYTVNYKGGGEFDIIEYHKIDNDVNDEIDDRESKGGLGSYDRLSVRDETTQGKHKSDSYDVTDGGANRNNAGLDPQAPQGESKQTESDAGSQKYQGWRAVKRDSATGRTTFVDESDFESTAEDWEREPDEFFKTSRGEVYGYATPEGAIYLDERVIKKSRTCVRDFFIKACPPGQPDCLL